MSKKMPRPNCSFCSSCRKCPRPPPPPDPYIFSEWDTAPAWRRQQLNVGATFYYQCDYGHFILTNGSTTQYLEVTCTDGGDEAGRTTTAPVWMPFEVYDPFPRCLVVGTYRAASTDLYHVIDRRQFLALVCTAKLQCVRDIIAFIFKFYTLFTHS